jgi:hypothetical protein
MIHAFWPALEAFRRIHPNQVKIAKFCHFQCHKKPSGSLPVCGNERRLFASASRFCVRLSGGGGERTIRVAGVAVTQT